jgi:hypothetical protein
MTDNNWYRDRLLAQQTDAMDAQAAALKRQADAADMQAQVQQERLDLEREIQRAKDLGITHKELLRRQNDVDSAESELETKTIILDNCAIELGQSNDVAAAKREIRREMWGLNWRNKWNYLRHPFQTSVAIKPFADQIGPRVTAARQLRSSQIKVRQSKAQQDVILAQQHLRNCQARV